MSLPPRTAEYAVPPSAYANPYAAGAEVSALICAAVHCLRGRFRTRREVRLLNRIGVLPLDWDCAGRHASR